MIRFTVHGVDGGKVYIAGGCQREQRWARAGIRNYVSEFEPALGEGCMGRESDTLISGSNGKQTDSKRERARGGYVDRGYLLNQPLPLKSAGDPVKR